jgi:hypothetical protein
VTAGAYGEQAALFRAALLLGLVQGREVVGWADQVLAGDAAAPAPFVDLATTPPGDLTLLRERLLEVCGPGEPEVVVRRLLGLVQRDLLSGRRSFPDTMTVLKQLRAFVKVTRELNEHLKALGVAVALAPPASTQAGAAEQRVRAWLEEWAIRK